MPRKAKAAAADAVTLEERIAELEAENGKLSQIVNERDDSMLTRSAIEKAQVDANAANERANRLQRENTELLGRIGDLEANQVKIDAESGSATVQ